MNADADTEFANISFHSFPTLPILYVLDSFGIKFEPKSATTVIVSTLVSPITKLPLTLKSPLRYILDAVISPLTSNLPIFVSFNFANVIILSLSVPICNDCVV